MLAMTNDEKMEQFITYTVENFIKKKKVFLKFKIIAITQENIEGAAHLLCNLKDRDLVQTTRLDMVIIYVTKSN